MKPHPTQKKKIEEIKVTPIVNPAMFAGEWTPDASYTTPPPAADTLSALIHDLTQTFTAPEGFTTPEALSPILDVTAIEAPEATTEPAVSQEQSAELDDAILEQLNQLLAEPPVELAAPISRSERWFLGIDIGTTGISAVLLNQATCQLYPLYWQTHGADQAKKKFRLSTAVTLTTTEPSASPLPTIRLEPSSLDLPRLSLSNWKPYLKVAVPHHSPQTSQWEPVLQWTETQNKAQTETQTVPLRTLQEVLQQLLTSLNPELASFMPSLTCGAVGLELEELQAVLQQLTGVLVGYPSNWSDTYSFNVREAILQAKLVAQPDQIVFIEEAIATLLSALPAADGRAITLAQQRDRQGHLHNADWQGTTLVLSAGASLTELVLVNLPAQLTALNHTDFYIRSLPYAGQGIDQDIICQLLYPALTSHNQTERSPINTPVDASADLSLEPFDLNNLGLAACDLPNATELDLAKRYVFQRHLEGSIAGQQLLTTAQSLKITLQQQNQFVLQWGTERLKIERQDLTSHVLLPYVQRLNRELNTILAQTNTTANSVKQVICTGGTASLSAIARWLRQKLPNATIIQDTYARPVAHENCIPSCSRVAYGLATLPLHPQVIDVARHRFGDYFLLRTLLHTLPQKPQRLETIMQMLEKQGIDTQACRYRILALLDGHLPPGLIPAEADLALLTSESAANPDYQAVRLAPLTKQTDRTYEPNRHQWDYLQHYLETLLADTEQTLKQPLQLEVMTRTEL